jgi:broad specificity phosphatase PhoE
VSVRLTLICHASTAAVRAAAFPLDEPIDQPGRAKAAALTADLASHLGRVDAAWVGPELRTRQTAEALSLAATVDPALRDIDLGRWAGRSFDAVLAAEPAAIAAWTGEPDAAPHGGESVIGLLGRVRPWLDALRQKTGRFVAVTHPAIIRAAVIVAIDSGPASFWRIDVAPLCRVRIEGNQSRWTLRSLET